MSTAITALAMLALRDQLAVIPATDENALTLADIANRLNALFVATGYDAERDEEKLASLWCVDADDTFGGFDMDVARLGLDENDMREIAVSVFKLLPLESQTALRAAEAFGAPMNAAEFAAIYPNLDRAFQTGGGCTAFYLPCGEDGAYALVTDVDGDPCSPNDTDVEGMLGFYDNESYLDTCWILPFAAIEMFVDIQWSLLSADPMKRLADLRIEWIGHADRIGDETPESEAEFLRGYAMEVHGGSKV